MAAIELANGKKIQSSREESDPCSTAHGIQKQVGGEGGRRHQEAHQRPGSAEVKKGARRADWRADQQECAERADEGGRGNKKGIARIDAVMTAGKIMSQFMRQKNCEERDGKGDSAEEKRRMLIGEAKGFKERIEGRGPVVSISGGKMSAGDERSEKREEEKSTGEDKRFHRRMGPSRFVVVAMAWKIGPRRGAQKNGSALFWFRRVHKVLFCSGRRGVFESLKFFAGLEANGFSRRDADLFAGAGIATNASFSGLDAEDAELAKFDALPAAEGALERLKDGFDGLLRFGAADVRLCDHCVYDVELDHNRPPRIRGPMLEATARVVKAGSLNYTSTFSDYTIFVSL